MANINLLKRVLLPSLLCLVILGESYLASAATMRLVPLNRSCQPGQRIDYSLYGDGLKGLGSIELTLRYPSGKLKNARVVFDGSLRTGSAAALANTNSPGAVRIGIIDAMGFSNSSGEIARISFATSELTAGTIALSASAHVTDLHGKAVSSRMEVEPVQVEAEKTDENETGDDSDPTPRNASAEDTASPVPTGLTGRDLPKYYSKNPQLAHLGRGAEPGAPRSAYYSSRAVDQKKVREKEMEKGLSGLRTGFSEIMPTGLDVRKIQGENNLYEVNFSLPTGNVNFALANGEIVDLVRLTGKARLRIRAQNGCMLYLLFGNVRDIERIALGSDLPHQAPEPIN